MLRDRAKNTLRAARNLKTLTSKPTLAKDSVGVQDQNDLYRFRVQSRSGLDLQLTGFRKRANISVQLFSFKGAKNKALRAIGRIDFSELKPKNIRPYLNRLAVSKATAQSLKGIQRVLEPGVYYARVFQRKGNSRYQLKLSAVPTFPQTTWSRQFGTPGNDLLYGITNDSAGNVYLSGVTNSVGGNGTSFVASYDPNGNELWRRELVIPGSDVAFDVEVDAVGNYYVAGASNISSAGGDAYVAKYDRNGTELWRKTIETRVTTSLGSEKASDNATGIALDRDGNVYVSGYLRVYPTIDQGNAFIAKYNNNGELVTSFGNSGIVDFGDAGGDAASAIAIDDENIYITGLTNATLTGTPASFDLFGGNALVASFNRNTGSLIWSTALTSGAQSETSGRDIVVQGEDLYIVGQTAGTLPSVGTINQNAGNTDGFLARYNKRDGRFVWAKQIGSSGLDAAQGVSADSAGRIYVSGETTGSLFGQTPLGSTEAWVAQYDSNGNVLKASLFGTPEADGSYRILSTSNGTLYVAGQTTGSLPGTQQNQGVFDAWVARYN